MCADIVEKSYSPLDWNIYAFHFSDGDNLLSDNELCFQILKKELLPNLNDTHGIGIVLLAGVEVLRMGRRLERKTLRH